MKGALSSKPNYQFDAEGHLAKSAEDEPDEVTFLKESVVLYIEGQSTNHPADVAASNAPEEPPPPEALAVGGTRRIHQEETHEETHEEQYTPPSDEDEASGETHSHQSKKHRQRGR